MIIVKIIGGLGNQLFQYSYAKKLQTLGYHVKLDISCFETYELHSGYGLDKYNIDLDVATSRELSDFKVDGLLPRVRKKLHLEDKNIFYERQLSFNKIFLEPRAHSYIEGYFQTEKYFSSIREILVKQLSPNMEMSQYTYDLKKLIIEIGMTHQTVSVHIRRGDYLNPQNSKIYSNCSLNYYQIALEKMSQKFGEVKFFIFSDDIKWVEENLNIENSFLVDNKKGRLPHEDLYLMSQCNHNIIANSSFSWWGAWLNQYQHKVVIAPAQWFVSKKNYYINNILCDEWLACDN